MEKEVEKQDVSKRKALVTSRVLFISVLDKIYLVTLIICFLGLTIVNFRGNIGSIAYGFWHRIGNEIIIILIMTTVYFFLNWLYRCAAKTMLCLTENEVYKEHYIPFKRTETSIPLKKITGVTTHNILWIFRVLIIHQYGKLPMLFWTWTNQEFKDKLTELVMKESKKIENEFDAKNIISKEMYKYLKYISLAFVAVLMLLGIVRFFAYTFNSERKLVGTYVHESEQIILNEDGSCDIDDIIDDVTECLWNYDKENKVVNLTYEYYPYSYYWGTSTGKTNLTFDSKAKTLSYDNVVFTK